MLTLTPFAAPPRLLMYSGMPSGHTHHQAIEWGIALMKGLSQQGGFAYDTSRNPAVFTDSNLSKYQAIEINCGCAHDEELTPPMKAAIQRFIERGGGWMGVHCAARILLDWPWYTNLIGAVHRHHTPGVQLGVLRVDDPTNIATTQFPSTTWKIPKPEELYFYLKHPAPSWLPPNPELAKVNVLLTFMSWGNGNTKPDPANADSNAMGGIAWYHEYDGGRAWYTGLGHEQWLFSDSLYIKLLLGGLKYVLKLDGTSSIVDKNSGVAIGHDGSKAWIGMTGRNSGVSTSSIPGLMQGYRLFDIQGNRLREISPGSQSGAAPNLMTIGVPKN